MPDDDEFDPEEAVALPLDGVLDLHAFAPRDVPDLLPTWLDACQDKGLIELRIIHGKGRGVLRRSVHAILERRDDIARFALAPEDRGGWGATLITLKPRGGSGG
jgi:DNA-nicking Smr family endonuclease